MDQRQQQYQNNMQLMQEKMEKMERMLQEQQQQLQRQSQQSQQSPNVKLPEIFGQPIAQELQQPLPLPVGIHQQQSLQSLAYMQQ